MRTLNITLPPAMKAFVDEQVAQGGYGNSSEYLRELIRKDQDRAQLRGLLLNGVASKQDKTVGPPYLDGLRKPVRARKQQ